MAASYRCETKNNSNFNRFFKGLMKINIIGAGMSGLCLGTYLQLNGFQTEIFEKHSIPGGLCTSWDKNGYTIDGCVHWILGSKNGSSFHKMWTELFDIDSIPFHDHDQRLELVVKDTKNKYGENVFRLYTDTDKLENYLLDLAPEDEKQIKRMVNSIRTMQRFDLPPVMEDESFIKATITGIKMLKYLEFLYLIYVWKNETNYTFADKLKNPFLKESFRLLFDDNEVNMLVLTMPMSSFGLKSAGYPIGGSLEFAKKMEAAYFAAGGKIRYKTPVKKILVENNKAVGLLLRNNVTDFSDITISSADWHHTIYETLEGKYVTPEITKLKDLKVIDVFYSVMLVSFGITIDMKHRAHFSRFPITKAIVSPDGNTYTRLEAHFYNYDPTMAPAGKTVVVSSFYTTNGDYWIDLRKNDRKKYREYKQQFADAVLEGLEEQYPEIKGKIDMTDVGTPATVARYTNSWKGSAQGWLPGKNMFARNPMKMKLKGLDNFYLASHWNIPGGGLPITIITARDTARYLSKKYHGKFVTRKSFLKD